MTDGGRSSAKWFYECMPAPAIVAVLLGLIAIAYSREKGPVLCITAKHTPTRQS